jgi:hypothetical protein
MPPSRNGLPSYPSERGEFTTFWIDLKIGFGSSLAYQDLLHAAVVCLGGGEMVDGPTVAGSGCRRIEGGVES